MGFTRGFATHTLYGREANSLHRPWNNLYERRLTVAEDQYVTAESLRMHIASRLGREAMGRVGFYGGNKD